ncbi:molecular chaperone TorD family protein [Halorubrum rutilum]|uniref:Molecular chaperone TorD family protein n=1 Tax=Halorubrum rutilum TaxID=1364933 RepID=A0ABD6AGZ3_9EURY|nr:molecular chaperone TorD family protein [Halorubrum rutilum]
MTEHTDATTDDADDGSHPVDAPGRHGSRAALYAAAAGAFCYPEPERVAALTADDAIESLRTAAATVDCAAAGDALADALSDPALDDETLADGYDALFGLPGDEGEYPVVPYEANYTVRDDIGARQRRIATVSGLLEQFDLARADSFHERRDHVAVELELLQVLAARRALAAEEGDRERAEQLALAEATVLDRHLADFIPALAHELGGAVEREAGPDPAADVYVAAADLATALVERDRAAHPEPPEPETGGEPA